MLHVHRHVNGLRVFLPVVLTQKREGTWAGVEAIKVRRSPWRFLARFAEKRTGAPWQISGSERDRMLKEVEGCSLLHVFFGNAAIHLLPLLRACPVPFVVSFHGSDVAGSMASTGYGAALREMFSLAALVPCRSEALADSVAALGCPREKLAVMRTMVPETNVVLRSPPIGGDWQFVQAARLVPKKGVATALKAFAMFSKRRPKARFVIAGEGPQEVELKALAGSLGVADQVEFAGFLGQENLKSLFERSFAFVHPSETAGGDVEGVPNAMLEAMACGMPVIATRHGGIPEVITHGVNGLLVDEGDVEGLAREMERIACSATLSISLGEAAAHTVHDQFSPVRQIAGIEAMYRDVIASRTA